MIRYADTFERLAEDIAILTGSIAMGVKIKGIKEAQRRL